MDKYRLKFRYLALLALIPAILLVHYSQVNMGSLSPFLNTINLFGTFMHEGGHTTFALLTGGFVRELVVRPDGSGYADIGGGLMFLVLPFGYMTTTLLPAVMFYVNNRTRFGELIPLLLGIMYIGLTFIFGAKLAGGTTTMVVGYVSGLLLLILALHHIRIPFPVLLVALYIVLVLLIGAKLGVGSETMVAACLIGTIVVSVTLYTLGLFHKKVMLNIPNLVWMSVVNLIAFYYGLGGILSLQYLSWNAAHGNTDDISRFTDMYFPFMQPTFMATILMYVSILVWLYFAFLIFRYLRSEKAETD